MGAEPREERAADGARVGDGGSGQRGRAILRAVVASAIASLTSCTGDRAPWEESTGGKPKFGGADTAPEPIPPAPEVTASDGRLESGGIFVSCSAGLTITGSAPRDVARLGLACGPVAGMKRANESPIEGTLSVGGADLEFPLKLDQGRCYRVFVAAEAPGAEIAVDVTSGRGVQVASETLVEPLGQIPATRPLCALGDDAATLRISMRCAPGEPKAPCPRTGLRFAASIWAR